VARDARGGRGEMIAARLRREALGSVRKRREALNLKTGYAFGMERTKFFRRERGQAARENHARWSIFNLLGFEKYSAENRRVFRETLA